MGDGQTQTVPYNTDKALAILEKIQAIKQLSEEPFEAIGWSKCLDCGYNEFCWNRAKISHAVAMLPGVDQALGRALYREQIASYDDLLSKFDETTLAEMQIQVSEKVRKVGRAARKILNHAKAFQSGQIIKLHVPAVKKDRNLVMFDVEGIPPHLDHAEKTYLWGIKVFGETPRGYSPALATATQDGDKEGWQKFLSECASIFSEYGPIPFVHWSSYEKTQISKYIQKYGDENNIAARVLESLHDLRPIVENAFVLPTPTYGLKRIEQFAGYKRQLAEAGGKWSMATYIEAVETADPNKASELMTEIVKYNEEDLDAMWAVYEWIAANA
jgi:predicted RecB family nuclease